LKLLLEFQAKCLAIIERVRKTRAELVTSPPIRERGPWLGRMKGTGKIVGDIVSAAADPSDWEVLQD